jgi:hypothetical protein
MPAFEPDEGVRIVHPRRSRGARPPNIFGGAPALHLGSNHQPYLLLTNYPAIRLTGMNQ